MGSILWNGFYIDVLTYLLCNTDIPVLFPHLTLAEAQAAAQGAGQAIALASALAQASPQAAACGVQSIGRRLRALLL